MNHELILTIAAIGLIALFILQLIVMRMQFLIIKESVNLLKDVTEQCKSLITSSSGVHAEHEAFKEDLTNNINLN